MVVAGCPKILDAQCIWGRIFLSLEKIFVFKYSIKTISSSFDMKYMCGKSVTRTFLVNFFGGAYTVQMVPKYM